MRGQGAMASYPQRSREEIELDLLQFELVKRRVLLGLAVLLCLSAMASTIICALHGWGWPVASSGLSVAVLAGLSVRGASPPADGVSNTLPGLLDRRSDGPGPSPSH
jgi:hypothetical protein